MRRLLHFTARRADVLLSLIFVGFFVGSSEQSLAASFSRLRMACSRVIVNDEPFLHASNQYLRVPICGGVLSCGQSGPFNSGEVKAVAQEFHKDYGFGGSGDEFR